MPDQQPSDTAEPINIEETNRLVGSFDQVQAIHLAKGSVHVHRRDADQVAEIPLGQGHVEHAAHPRRWNIEAKLRDAVRHILADRGCVRRPSSKPRSLGLMGAASIRTMISSEAGSSSTISASDSVRTPSLFTVDRNSRVLWAMKMGPYQGIGW